MKMETYYQKNYAKEQKSEQRKPGVYLPLVYQNELAPKDKDNMYKEIYSSIDFFDEIIRKALQELKGGTIKKYDSPRR